MYKALIVDDERMIREGIQAAVNWRALEISHADTASSAIEALTKHSRLSADIIITDISMTEMTGLELIKKINQASPQVKILVLTGYDSFEYAQSCLHMEVEDFLLKPVEESVLEEALKRIVRKLNREKEAEKTKKTFMEMKSIILANTGNPEEIQKAFETFEKTVKSYNTAHAMVCRCCFEIASSLYFTYISDTGGEMDGKLVSLSHALHGAKRNEALEFTKTFIFQILDKDIKTTHEIIAKAKQIIAEDLAEELSVTNLAETLYVTPNYFSRLFKRITGEGCNEYIVRKRMEKAKYLLETTTLKMSRIAAMVGYRDTNYFSLAFKRHTGMSPTVYREKNP